MWVENGRVQTLKHARLAANRNTKPKFIKVVLIDAQLKGGWSVKVLRLEDMGWARGGEKGAEKNSEKTGPFVFKRPQRMIRTELNKKLHMTRFPSHFCIRCHFILFVWERNEGEQSIWKRSAKSGEEGCWFVPFYNKNFLFTDCLVLSFFLLPSSFFLLPSSFSLLLSRSPSFSFFLLLLLLSLLVLCPFC